VKTPVPAAMDAASYSALASLGYAGSQKALERLDREIAAAGRDPARLSVVVSNLAGVLRQPGVTLAARQAISQRLGQLLVSGVDDGAALAALAPMLSDPELVNVARLALEPVKGATVDALFMRALEGAGGSLRLALVQSVGNRRIEAAVPALGPLLAGADRPTADAAARALGGIGTAEALAALEEAPNPEAPAVVDARLACIAREPGAPGVEALRSIFGDARVSGAQRAAAWKGLLEREPSAAAQRLVVVLQGDDRAFKQVALEAIAALGPKGVARELCENLVTFDAPTQASVIDALARGGDAEAVPAVLASTRSADASVRAAAIAALGVLPGDGDTVMALAQIASRRAGADARLAYRSLAGLSGPGVDSAVIAGATGSDPDLRAVFLEAIGLRDMAEADPLLLRARDDSDAGARVAALRSLSSIAPVSDEGAILAWAVAAVDAREAAGAERALVSVSLRNPDAAARARPVIEAIESGTEHTRLLLLPALPRLGDGACAACAARMALGSTGPVALAATSALSNWPNGAALPQLVLVAERTGDAGLRAAAMAGAIGAIERGRTTPSAEPSDLVGRLIGAAQDPATRKHLVLLLSRGSGDSALSLAKRLEKDPALGGDAGDAVLAIRANRNWPPRLKASADSEELGNMVDGDPKTAWGAPSAAVRWIQVDFGRSRPVRRITLDQEGRLGDFPEHYEVYVTDDPDEPGRARAAGAGETGKTVIELPPGIRGRYVVIRDLSKSTEGPWWSVSELQVD
jgi:HEAT repeat protein